MRVVVVDYDPSWPERFDALRRLLEETLGGAAVAIEHVGSTSVPELPAKPITDVDVALADYSKAHELRRALELAGFRRTLAGDFPDRQFYIRDDGGRRSHLSLTYLGSETWLSHRALRDRLRADPEARRGYGDANKRPAAQGLDAGGHTHAETAGLQGPVGPAGRPRPPPPR